MTTKAPAAPAKGKFQRYEYVDEKSSKFWEIRNEGTSVEVRYGKIGTTGQSLTKDFDEGAAARKHADKRIAEKLKGGYQPASSSVGSAPKKDAAKTAKTSAKTATEPKAATPVKVGPKAISKRDIAIQRKMAEGLLLKSEILAMLDADPEFDKEEIFPSHSTPAEIARKRLHFLTETFKPKTRVIAFESANRMASMFPGPFFCSTNYPQPKTKSGTSFFPILQVDLDWLESLTGKQFGRGLMQLWFDYEDKFSEYIRVIPPSDLNSAELIPFDFNGLREAMAESYLFSEEWQFLDEMKCHEISTLHSEGLTCPKLLLPLEEILGDITEVEDPSHKALLEKVADLESLLSEDWETHFFGSFSPIQMSVEDFFPSHCFMSIEQWGSGNAQIFYTPSGKSESARFSFSHCPRG